MQAVYVITANANLVKVGRSANPEARIDDLQGSNGTRLTLEYTRVVSQPAAVERAVHRLLAPWRLRGEWFHCDPDIAVMAVHSVVEDRRDRFSMLVNERASLPSMADRIRENTRRAIARRAD